MSWLNLNESFNSLKGQITNFATEVLSEAPAQETDDEAVIPESSISQLQEKCKNQELEIAALKKLNDELQASLQSERLARQNGVKEEESSWYWDPPSQSSKHDNDCENHYKAQIRELQNEISALKEHTIDLRPDAEEEINRLREENQNLTANLEDLDNQHQQAMERLLSLKKELQKNFEVLKQDYEALKNSNDEYANEVKALLDKDGERDKEIESIKAVKSDYDTLHHKYQNLERIYALLRENAEKFQEENQDLHEEVFKLQEQVTKAEHDLEILTKNAEVSLTVPKEKYDEVLKELNDLKDRRNANQIHLDEINIDDNAKSVIEKLKHEINDLRHQLNQKQVDSQGDADHKIIKADKIMQLYNKYVNFEIPLDYVGEIPSVGDNLVIYKLESVFKTVNSFKKDIDTLEHQMSEKNNNINHLQDQIDELTAENDFLTTDIQHFEKELNSTKSNNDFLLSEITTLKNTSKLEPIIETNHEDNLVKLENELADCNKVNKTFESEIKNIELELAEVRKEKNSLQESLTDLKTKYTAMISEIDVCKNKTSDVEELEKQVISQQNEMRKTETDDLKKKLTSANSKNEQLSIDIHIVEDDKVLLTKQVDDLKNTIEEKTAANKQLQFLKLALDLKLQDFETKLDEVILHRNEVEVEKAELEKKVASLNTQLTDCHENITDLKTKLQVEHTKLTDLLTKTDAETKNEEQTKQEEEIEKLKPSFSLSEASVQNVTSKASDESDNLKQEIAQKNEEISSFNTKLEKLITTAENKDKEIKELNQSLVEFKDRNKTPENVHQNDDYAYLLQEKKDAEMKVTELNVEISKKENEITELKANIEVIEKLNADNKIVIDKAMKERTDMLRYLNLKHNESIRYYNEVIRLNQLCKEKETGFKRALEQIDDVIEKGPFNCDKFIKQLQEKDEIINALNLNTPELERLKSEIADANEIIKNLTDKCDIADKNQIAQLEAVKKLTAENAQLSEQEQNSVKELERLRRHLVETEENYTQELMASEQKLAECQTRLQAVEERAKQTSTVYTSNSIRANQEVETLRTQIKLLEKQREEVQTSRSEAEDASSRSEAALTNLQIVLEQFQMDKERDIHTATEKIRNKMAELKRQNSALHDEIAKLNNKLDDSLAGLQAATRLGDQLETKTAQMNDLKEQVKTLQTSVAAAEERYYNAISNQQDKVDKNLVKNLIINYVLSALSSKLQVLRILSTVLDFNQQECEKLGLVRSSAPDSLAAEFVKFLQDESKPRPPAPANVTISRSTTPTVSRRSSTTGPNPTFNDATHKRNPSTASTSSNNLLFTNIENVETSSQLSRDSAELRQTLDTGVNQTRNNEGAILKHVLRDM